MNRKFVICLVFLFLIAGVAATEFGGSYGSGFSGSGSYAFSSPAYAQPGFRGTSAEYYSKYPGYDRQTCEARQDFLIQIAPGSCVPAVVRSDLLAEQNVHVFCKLQAIQLNPTIETSTIRSVSLSHQGQLPEGVAGVAYHRPRIAWDRGRNTQGLFSIDNFGYVVIKLKQQPDERLMVENVTGKLTARVKYQAYNAFGLGNNEMISPVVSLDDWKTDYPMYSFMDGRFYLRVESLTANKARVSVYRDVDTKIDTFNLVRGKPSQEKYLPGFDCNAAYKLVLVDSVDPKKKARLFFEGNSYEVYEGERFAEVCKVSKIVSDGLGAGSVTGTCYGKKFNVQLQSKPVVLEVERVENKFSVGDKVKEGVWVAKAGNAFGEDYVLLFSGEEFGLKEKSEAVKAGRAYEKDGELIEGFHALTVANLFWDGITLKNFKGIEDVNSRNSKFDSYFEEAIGSYLEVDSDYGQVEKSEGELYGAAD